MKIPATENEYSKLDKTEPLIENLNYPENSTK